MLKNNILTKFGGFQKFTSAGSAADATRLRQTAAALELGFAPSFHFGRNIAALEERHGFGWVYFVKARTKFPLLS